MSSSARRTSSTDRAGSRSATAQATPSRHVIRVSAISVRSATSSAVATRPYRSSGGVGEAEVVEDGDPDEQVAGRSGGSARRATPPRTRAIDASKSPRHASASHRIRPPRPVGRRSARRSPAPRVPRPRAGRAPSCPTPTRSARTAPPVAACGSSHTSSSGRTTSARSWRPRRKKLAGGPHSPAASSPERGRAASSTASRQLPVSRSRRTEHRSTSAVHGVVGGQAGDRGHPPGQRGPGGACARRARRGARTRTPASSPASGSGRRAWPASTDTMLLATSDATCAVADGTSMPRAPATWRAASSSKPSTNTASHAEQPLLVGFEQPIRPLDRGSQRRVPVLDPPAPALEHGRALVQRVEGSRSRRASRRERRRARWPAAARRGERTAARPTTGPRRRGRRRRRGLAGGTARPRRCSGSSGRTATHVLAVDAERLAARHQHGHAGAAGGERVDGVGGAVDHVLAVVDDQQRRAVAEHPGQAVERIARPAPSPTAAAMAPRTSAGSVRPASGTKRIARRAAPSGPGAAPVVGRASDVDGQPGLADPADAGQRHDALALEQRGDGGGVAVTPDERRAVRSAAR